MGMKSQILKQKPRAEEFGSNKSLSTEWSYEFPTHYKKEKHINCKSSKDVWLKVNIKLWKEKRAGSIQHDKILASVTGIDEVSMDEEESPSLVSDSSKFLPCIEEEKHFMIPKKWENIKYTRISSFLDKFKIFQVFPSELNSIKLAMAAKKKHSHVPKLSLGMNSLLAKRNSSKWVPLQKLNLSWN